MPLSSRLTPADRVGTATPYRMHALGKAVAGSGQVAADTERQALVAAFRKGFETGHGTALAEAGAQCSQLARILAGHDAALARLDDELAGAVIALAVDLAAHVTRAHLALREDAVIPVVRDALELIREEAAPARLHLNPADGALVERELGADLAKRNCRVISDPALAHGECRLEGAHAEIDATLAARWRKALAPLGESLDWLA